MLDTNKFDWGNVGGVDFFKWEIFDSHVYEKLFEVEENDIVVDMGASVGPFTYSILHKKPKHCWVIEPRNDFFDTLRKNLEGYPISFTKAAITDKKVIIIDCGSYICKPQTLTFMEFINNNNLYNIDFLKMDIEGDEYGVFTEENYDFLMRIPKIAAEFHLAMEADQKYKFKYFRDTVLKKFPKYYIRSVDSIPIEWDVFNEHFIQHYEQIMIYFDNRKQ